MLIDIHGGPFVQTNGGMYPLSIGARLSLRAAESSSHAGLVITVGVKASLFYLTWADFRAWLLGIGDTRYYFAVQICGCALYLCVQGD